MRKRLPDPLREDPRNPGLPLRSPRKITLITCGVCGQKRPNKGRGLCAEHYLAEYKAGRIHRWKLDRQHMRGIEVHGTKPGEQPPAASRARSHEALAAELLELSARLAWLGFELKRG